MDFLKELTRSIKRWITGPKVKKLVQPLIKNWPIKLSMTLILVSAIFVVLLLTGTCGSVEIYDPSPEDVIVAPTPEPTPESTPEQTPEPTTELTPEPTIEPQETDFDTFNPLTGLPMEEAKTLQRPLAIVLSNEPAALPMNGVSSADIIYEYLVEGGLTRMLAFFQDFTDVPKVGSIRSARHYTVQLAASYDAVFIHAGGSQPLAYDEIRRLGIPNLDEVGGRRREIFFRDRSRVPGRRIENLHSVVTTGERVSRWFPEYNFRLEHEDDYVHGLAFTDDGTPVGGAVAENVNVRFSAAKSTAFSYDAPDKHYHIRQHSRDFTDATDGSRPGFTNIIIMRTRVSSIPGDGAGRQNVVTVGEGEGYFICGGSYIEINWRRADDHAPFVYTHKNGTPIELGRGKTFVCIVPTAANITFS